MASKEAQAEFQQYQAVQLGVVSRLKQAYYRLQYTYAASDLLTRDKDLLDKLLKVTEDRYSVGRAAQQDVFKAQLSSAFWRPGWSRSNKSAGAARRRSTAS